MVSMDLFLVWSDSYQLGAVIKGAGIQLHYALSVIMIGKSNSSSRSELNQSIFHWNIRPNFLYSCFAYFLHLDKGFCLYLSPIVEYILCEIMDFVLSLSLGIEWALNIYSFKKDVCDEYNLRWASMSQTLI